MSQLAKTAATSIAEDYLVLARKVAEDEISHRSLFRIPVYLFLFGAVLFVTPILNRYPQQVIAFGGFLAVLCVFRFGLAWSWTKFPEKSPLRKLMVFGIYLTAVMWGLFCAASILNFELGWISFFIILSTVGIAAGEISALAPSFPTLFSFMVLMLAPASFASFVFVPGLSGLALGLFFLGYLVFLIFQGRRLSFEYWEKLRESSQLRAMIDAVPGTVSWVSSSLVYLGVNRRVAELWGGKPKDFVGKEIGFLDPNSPFVEMVRTMFETDQETMSVETPITVNGKIRNYFLFGQKYHLGAEAIVLGLDVTEIRANEKAVLQERAQRYYSAQFANLGEASAVMYSALQGHMSLLAKQVASQSVDAIEKQFSEVRKLTDFLETLAHRDPKETTDLHGFLNDLSRLFGDFLARFKISLEVVGSKPGTQVAVAPGVMLASVVAIMNNAIDALNGSNKESKSLLIDVHHGEKEVLLSIKDNGVGVDPQLIGRIFEPLFTTKKEGTGIGLSSSREMIESFGGSIALDKEADRTSFVLTLPKK